jgi:ABC-type Na+ efflux pump permease subunit
MYEKFIFALSIAYACGGIVTFLGFVPTMRDLAHGIPSANVATYVVWTITTALAFLYGLFILRDPLFLIVIGLQLAACVVILALRLRLASRGGN